MAKWRLDAERWINVQEEERLKTDLVEKLFHSKMAGNKKNFLKEIRCNLAKGRFSKDRFDRKQDS